MGRAHELEYIVGPYRAQVERRIVAEDLNPNMVHYTIAIGWGIRTTVDHISDLYVKISTVSPEEPELADACGSKVL